MAEPAITAIGSSSAKASSTTLVVTVSTTVAVGDYLLVNYVQGGSAMVSGAVSFTTSGTATFATSVIPSGCDPKSSVNTGSGTRPVGMYAQCTGAGTVTAVTISHPSIAAQVAEVFIVTGADATTPIAASGNAVTVTAGPTLTPSTAGVDALFVSFIATETTSGSAVSVTTTSGWTATSHDSTEIGTTGGSGGSNVSTAYGAWSKAGISAVGVQNYVSVSTVSNFVSMIFQFIPAPTSTEQVVMLV